MLYDDTITITITISKNNPRGKSTNTKYKCHGSKCHGCTISTK